MKAVKNLPSMGNTPKGKYIDLSYIRKELVKYPDYSLQQLIDIIRLDELCPDMDEIQLSEYFKTKLTNNK